MALSSARPWRPRPRDYDGEIITASSEFISCPGPVTAITAEQQQLSGWWLLLWPSEVLMMICNYYTCLSPAGLYFHSWGLPRESLHYVPNGSLWRIFFIFPKHWRHQAVSAPGGSGARRSQQRRKWGMLPPKILNTEALVSNRGAGKRRSLCLIFRQPRLAASCVFSFSLSHEQEGGREKQIKK